jgi:hypothetical protein
VRLEVDCFSCRWAWPWQGGWGTAWPASNRGQGKGGLWRWWRLGWSRAAAAGLPGVSGKAPGDERSVPGAALPLEAAVVWCGRRAAAAAAGLRLLCPGSGGPRGPWPPVPSTPLVPPALHSCPCLPADPQLPLLACSVWRRHLPHRSRSRCCLAPARPAAAGRTRRCWRGCRASSTR